MKNRANRGMEVVKDVGNDNKKMYAAEVLQKKKRNLKPYDGRAKMKCKTGRVKEIEFIVHDQRWKNNCSLDRKRMRIGYVDQGVARRAPHQPQYSYFYSV